MEAVGYTVDAARAISAALRNALARQAPQLGTTGLLLALVSATDTALAAEIERNLPGLGAAVQRALQQERRRIRQSRSRHQQAFRMPGAVAAIPVGVATLHQDRPVRSDQDGAKRMMPGSPRLTGNIQRQPQEVLVRHHSVAGDELLGSSG